MGEQIHIGGFASSTALAQKAAIAEGMKGVDFCCCNGAGMRFLVRFHKVASMTGVDATEKVINSGKQRCASDGSDDRIAFVLADVCNTGLPAGAADFVWGEDAWCYVEDKTALVAEAARIVRPGGTIAFTDWVEGPAGLSDDEAERFLGFMKFPNILDIAAYTELLEANDCVVEVAEDTQQFAPHCELYLDMLNMQLTYDALRIIGFNMNLMTTMGGEMVFMHECAKDSKIAQGRFVAKKGSA